MPDPNHAELLARGAAAWNAWREKNPDTIPRLNGIAPKLAERQMGPINGGPTNLKCAELQAAFLRFATFSQADLRSADLAEADLTHARLDRADLTFANLNQAVLDHSDLEGANLTNASLRGASLRFASLVDSNLNLADLRGADLIHARLDRARLTGTDLSNALLDHANFEGAQLSDVDLSGANLYHAKNLTAEQLRETRRSEATLLPPCIKGLSELAPTILPKSESVDELHTSSEVDIEPRKGRRHSALLIGVTLIVVSISAAWQWGLVGRQLPPTPQSSLPLPTHDRSATAITRVQPDVAKPVSQDLVPKMHLDLTLSSGPIELVGRTASTAIASLRAPVPIELAEVPILDVSHAPQPPLVIEVPNEVPALNTTIPPALTATEDDRKVEFTARSPTRTEKETMQAALPPLPVRKPGVGRLTDDLPSRHSTRSDAIQEKPKLSTSHPGAKSAKREINGRNDREIQSKGVSPTDVLAGGL